jgi:hypothetical protein
VGALDFVFILLHLVLRPRLLSLLSETEAMQMEVMEHDLAKQIWERAGACGLLRREREQLPVFGWATLAAQVQKLVCEWFYFFFYLCGNKGIPPGEPLMLLREPAALPKPYLEAAASKHQITKEEEEDLVWESGGLLEAASLPALVALMTGKASAQQIQMILLTHASFTSSGELLRLLVQQGREQDHSTVIRVLKVLKQWLDLDHFLPDEIVAGIAAYLDRDVPSDLKVHLSFSICLCFFEQKEKQAPVQTLRNALLRWVRGDTRLYQIRSPPPAPVLLMGGKEARLRDWDPTEIARQITLPLFAIYTRIEAREFFSQPWNSPKTQHKCPHVMAMIQNYNNLASCVATSIVLSTTVSRRCKMFLHWIDICVALQQLQNYHSLSAIVSGLGNASILRLKHTKEALAKKSKAAKQFSELSDLCSMSGSFKNLRDAVNRGDPPKIPYIGVYLSDLVFIEDGNPNTVVRKRPSTGKEVELLFMAKRQLFHKIVSTIQTFQTVPYNLVPVEALQTFLSELRAMDDKELFAESLLREPREEK